MRRNGWPEMRVREPSLHWRESEKATDRTLAGVVSEPDDPTIFDLVRGNSTSVRLRNVLSIAVRDGTLPVNRVTQYLALGEGAIELFMRRVWGLGRKSATELDDLVRTRTAQRESHIDVDSKPHADEVRDALCKYFADVTFRESLGTEVPIRLSRALEQAGYADLQLPDVLSDLTRVWLDVSRQPNVGQISLRTAMRKLSEFIRSRLELWALSVDAASAGERLVLEGVVPDRCGLQDLEDLTERLERTAESAGWTGAGDGMLANPETKQSPRRVIDCIVFAMQELDQRSSEVIRGRYGLGGKRQILEDLGRVLGVTRERVRQIETKALRSMRGRVEPTLPQAMLANGEEHWEAITRGDGYLLASKSEERTRGLSPWFLLALDLRGIGVRDWLNEFAQRVEGGWIASTWGVEQLNVVRERVSARLTKTRLPCALAELVRGEVRDVAVAAIALSGFGLYGTYVVGGRVPRRLRRALRLHATLVARGRCTGVIELLRSYRSSTPTDSCSTRDCEIVMRDHTHLFLEVTEGCWAGLGLGGEVPVERSTTSAPGEPDAQKRPLVRAANVGRTTVRTIVAAELRRRGPSRLAELTARADDFLPAGRSAHSIGATMIQYKDIFRRVLPGVYALPDQVPSLDEMLAVPPPYVLRKEQARLYALARRAGEPWGTFPLWLPETEYLLCQWAKRRGDTELLRSLLAVAQMSYWPSGIDQEGWRQIAKTHGHFSLHFPFRGKALAAPKLDLVFAACLYVRDRNHLSWMSANRILRRRTDEHWSAGLLAVLVALGALTPEFTDWQSSHRPAHGLRELLLHLEAGHRSQQGLEWASSLGQALADEALIEQRSSGWVTTRVIRQVFRDVIMRDKSTAGGVNPLEELLVERSETAKEAEHERMLRSLSHNVGGDHNP